MARRIGVYLAQCLWSPMYVEVFSVVVPTG